MRNHEQFGQAVCNPVMPGAPCVGKHIYWCRACHTPFESDEDTLVQLRGRWFPNTYWPFCSIKCAMEVEETDRLAKKVLQRVAEELEEE